MGLSLLVATTQVGKGLSTVVYKDGPGLSNFRLGRKERTVIVRFEIITAIKGFMVSNKRYKYIVNDVDAMKSSS